MELQEPVCIFLLQSGALKVSVGLKGVAGSHRGVCDVVTTVITVTCCFWVLLLCLAKNTWVLPSFSFVLESSFFCFCFF